MASTKKNLLLVIGSVLAIMGSGLWIYYGQFKAPDYDVGLHQRIGEVMAEQTARALGPKGRILLITMPTRGLPELETQLDAFRRTLKKLGDYRIKDHELDTEGQPKYGVGRGLSPRRFVRAVNGHTTDAIVSFVGTPDLSDEQIAELKKKPKFIAETRSPEDLPKLFEHKIIQVAVTARFDFPAPGPLKPKTPQEWFNKRYQIVAADSVPSIPQGE